MDSWTTSTVCERTSSGASPRRFPRGARASRRHWRMSFSKGVCIATGELLCAVCYCCVLPDAFAMCMHSMSFSNNNMCVWGGLPCCCVNFLNQNVCVCVCGGGLCSYHTKVYNFLKDLSGQKNMLPSAPRAMVQASGEPAHTHTHPHTPIHTYERHHSRTDTATSPSCQAKGAGQEGRVAHFPPPPDALPQRPSWHSPLPAHRRSRHLQASLDRA